MRGGAQPQLGNRPDVMAVEGSGVVQAASAASAARKTRAAAMRVDGRVIAVSVARASLRGNGGPGRIGAGACLVPTPKP